MKTLLKRRYVQISLLIFLIAVAAAVSAARAEQRDILHGVSGQSYEMRDGQALIIQRPDGGSFIVESFDSTGMAGDADMDPAQTTSAPRR